MQKPVLVQRLQIPFKQKSPLLDLANAFSFGGGLKDGGLSENGLRLIENIFRFGYMGAAEFEWGAVPDALNKIARNRKSYITFEILVKTKESGSGNVYVICDRAIYQDVTEWIKRKAFDEFDKECWTMEHVWLQHAINSENRIFSGVCGWLELNNGFFFFTNKEMFSKTKELFGLNFVDKLGTLFGDKLAENVGTES